MVYYRCKICGEHHKAPMTFKDEAVFDMSKLTEIGFNCPKTRRSAQYDKKDMYWRDVDQNGGDRLLAEVIFELYWKLQEETGQGQGKDPHYKILIGRLYDKIRHEYPYLNELPASNIPDSFAAHRVQVQFRKDKDAWPVIQVGPGIVTLNETEEYRDWQEFRERISELVSALFEVHPAPEELSPYALVLRYINAIEFDYRQNNALQFLSEKMKTGIKLDEKLFQPTGVVELPDNLNLNFSFPSTKPNGWLDLQIGTGERHGSPSIVWHTSVRSIRENMPKTQEAIIAWADDAHAVARGWFDVITEDIDRRG